MDLDWARASRRLWNAQTNPSLTLKLCCQRKGSHGERSAGKIQAEIQWLTRANTSWSYDTVIYTDGPLIRDQSGGWWFTVKQSWRNLHELRRRYWSLQNQSGVTGTEQAVRLVIRKTGLQCGRAEMLRGLVSCLGKVVCLFVGCLTSQEHASVSQGRICSDSCTCCHTKIETADLTFHLTQSQYTDTGLTSPSTGPITPGAWQGSHWSANF